MNIIKIEEYKPMKVEDLIKALEEFKAKNGNVVVLRSEMGTGEGYEIEEVRQYQDIVHGNVALLW